MNLGLNGKCAVVTGGSKGIGRAIALGLAEEGANVAICARGEAALRRTEAELKEHGIEVVAEVCDVSNAEAFDRFLENAHAAFGQLDILVNNTSALDSSFADDDAAWQAGFDVDVMGAVRASRKVVPWFAETGGGCILHISSISGLDAGSPPAYAAAKAALISHSKTLAIALAPQKIRVNVIAPGSIEFPGGLWEAARENDPAFYRSVLETLPWGRLGTPEEVANAAVFLVSERARWITGVCLCVDGGQRKANT
jgi:3-oxoacyl-[acyl-carrier protein] reductase